MNEHVIILVALGTLSVGFGCAGSLEAARAEGQQERKLGSPAVTSDRCSTLDARRTFYGGVGKTAAALAGVSGLSTIPLDDPEQKDLRIGFAAAGVGAAAVAAGAMFVAEASGESWGRECASK